MKNSILNNESDFIYSKLEESSVKDYYELLKPRVMYLVIFTGIVGMIIAPGNIHPLLGFISIMCIALGSGAAGGINMWYERDLDAIMSRTKNRPLPTGKISPQSAIEFTIILALGSVILMGLFINIISGILLAAAILFYVFIYTIWLKKRTSQNIVIGGAAGAFPPLIGWAAVTNNITIEPIILFLIIFIWTPPHFWALALYRSDDYHKVNIPMLPLVVGDKKTKQQIIFYTILLFIISLMPFVLKTSGILYGIIALIMGVIFLYQSIILYNDHQNLTAPRLFKYSIFYLFILFATLALDKIIQ